MTLNIALILAFSLTYATCSAKLDLDFAARVEDAENTRIFEMPWQCSLQLKLPGHTDENPKLQHFCGGTIIHKNWILAAASCLENQNKDDILVVTGVRKWTGPRADEDRANYDVKEIFVHPDYNIINDLIVDADIALIQLDRNIKFGCRRKKAVLPAADETLSKKDNYTVAGWGRRIESDGEVSVILQSTIVTVLKQSKCEKAYEDIGGITDNLFCVKDDHGHICDKDEGAPLIADKKKVVGINSSQQCGSQPPLFTLVSNFVEWIKTTQTENKKK